MRSLAVKLTLAFLMVGLTGALLVAILTQQRTRAAFDQFLLNREQQALAASLVQYYQSKGSWAGVAESLSPAFSAPSRSPEARRDSHPNWERFALVGSDGLVVFSSHTDQVGQQASARDLARAAPLKVEGETAGWLLVSPGRNEWMPNSPEGLFLQNVNSASLASALVAVVLALTLGGLLAFTMTRSLRELSEATVAIARGQLGRQVKVRSRDELGDLAVSFNKMSLDLERATHARRQLTANVAHDLRSPLSVIAGYAEALSDGKLPGTPEVYAILHQETKLLSRLVEDLRTLSLADAGELSLTRQPIQPRTILERVAQRHAVAAQQKGIALQVSAPAGLPQVEVDPERMAQVFDNLLQNAFRHTPAGGAISLSAREVDGAVQLQVGDTGAGIDPEDLPYIFNRFYRGDKARRPDGESGLGLAIAKSLVAAHAGSLAVESAPGQGARFTITLGGK